VKRGLRPGIRSKLLIAFGLILATTLAASSIAFNAFNRFSVSLSEITQQNVPFMAESMALTQLGMEVSARVPLLSGSRTEAEAQLHYTELSSALQQIEQLLARENEADSELNPVGISDNIKDVLQVRSFLDELHEQVLLRVHSSGVVNDTTSSVSDLQLDINLRLLDTIDTATYDFVVMAEDIFSSNSDLIDTLLHRHVQIMINALHLQNGAAELTTLLSQHLEGREVDQQEAQRIAADLAQYRALLEGVLDGKQDALDANLVRLDSLSRGAKTILDRAEVQPFQAGLLLNELHALESAITTEMSTLVDEGYEKILQVGEELSQSVTLALPEFMNEGVQRLVSLLQLRAELNTMAGLLAQVSRVTQAAELQPLADRYVASLAAIETSLSELSSNAELATVQLQIRAMTALGNVDNGLFRDKYKELSRIDQIMVTEEALGRTQADFVDHLVTQVQVSRSLVDESSMHVSSLIASSRLQLISVSLLSILFTLTVFWLLISRDLLARLLHTITALRSLADGNYEVSVNSTGSDELADLARTVEVFRRNALEAQRLQEEQLHVAEKQKALENAQAESDRLMREEEDRRHEQEQAASARQHEEASHLQRRVDKLMAAVSAAAEGNLNHPIDTAGDDLAGQMRKGHFHVQAVRLGGIGDDVFGGDDVRLQLLDPLLVEVDPVFNFFARFL
jgi:hypothetical protein